MIEQIKTIKDVKTFAKQLINEGLNFHPDDDFNDYINVDTKKRSYTKSEASLRNKLMDESFKVCEEKGKDIYNIMHKVALFETGMNK